MNNPLKWSTDHWIENIIRKVFYTIARRTTAPSCAIVRYDWRPSWPVCILIMKIGEVPLVNVLGATTLQMQFVCLKNHQNWTLDVLPLE
jgi:hypothetical protein